jgi:thymidylate kinase
MMEHRKAIVVSFSGIDGAGKSTQIEMLRTSLAESGLTSSLLTFWDDVVMLSAFREFCSHAAFGGDKGVGSPDKPISRKDKNVSSWPVMLMRLVFYVFDVAHLSFMVAKAKRSHVSVLIFDRYIYDELANLPLQQRFFRAYVQGMLKLAPRPDVAYIIDADPAVAIKRKPEYPYDFLKRNRASYLELNEIDKVMTIIAPGSVIEAHTQVVKALANKLPAHQQQSFSSAKALIPS